MIFPYFWEKGVNQDVGFMFQYKIGEKALEWICRALDYGEIWNQILLVFIQRLCPPERLECTPILFGIDAWNTIKTFFGTWGKNSYLPWENTEGQSKYIQKGTF